MRVVTICMTLIFVIGCFADVADESDFDANLEQQLLRLVNEERQKRGIAPLEWSEQLTQSARRHTERLAESGLLSHQFKGEPRLAERIAATGLKFYASGENVGLANEWPDIHPGFMRSEGHRKNILAEKYNAGGMGVVKRNGYFYVTQNFARISEGLSVASAEQRISRLVGEAHGRTPIRVEPSQSLRAAACEMAKRDDVEASAVPLRAGARGALAFTANELNELPQGLDKIARRQDVTNIVIGACFQATKTYPGGTYWFAVQY